MLQQQQQKNPPEANSLLIVSNWTPAMKQALLFCLLFYLIKELQQNPQNHPNDIFWGVRFYWCKLLDTNKVVPSKVLSSELS